MSKHSQHKDLAFAFAAHMTSPELTRKLTAQSGTAVNPSRTSHFSNPESWNQSGFSTESARDYLQTITQSLSNPNVVYDITIPGAGEYYTVFDEALALAVAKKLSPQKAMDQAAQRWEAITDRLDRTAQIGFYQASLNVGR